MAALADLIKFRKLNDELTDKEFFGQFCKTIGREAIVSIFYEHFKSDLDALQSATNIQSNILRKRGDIEDEPSSYDCIDQLPSYLIAKCGSFLDYKDYFHFGSCNRNIYYSLYSPPMIHEFEYMERYDNVNFTAFKNVSTLQLYIQDFEELPLSDRSTWQSNASLRTLELFSRDWDGSDTEEMLEKELMFLDDIHLIKGDNIRHLSLSSMFYEKTVFGILSTFDQIEYLEINGETLCDESYFAKCDDLKLCNLRHLKLYKYRNDRDLPGLHLINLVCHQLESLSFLVGYKDLLPDTLFPKLKLFMPGRGREWNDSYFKAFEKTKTLQNMDIDFNMEQIEPFFELVSRQESVSKIKISFSYEANSYALLDKIEQSLIKYEVGVEDMKEVLITVWSSVDVDKNKAFGEQIFRIFKLWQSEASGLKMTIYHTNIDMKDAGLSSLDELDRYCDVVVWTQDSRDQSIKIDITPFMTND